MTIKGQFELGRLPLLATSKRILLTTVACGLFGVLGASSAWAEPLEQALAKAYSTNPSLDAQRAAVRATDEGVAQARSGYRPQVSATANAGVSRSVTEQTGGVGTSSTSINGTFGRTNLTRSLGVTAQQPVYTGGRVPAQVSSAENEVQSQRAQLLNAEQQVLSLAAEAYMNVVRDQATVRLNVSNEQVLRRQMEAAQDRFRVGEITRTDVSQAESRLARATADRVTAEGRLSASRAAYTRIVGTPPGELAAPKVGFKLPKNQDEVVDLALSNNPTVLAAAFSEKARRDDIDVVNADRLPQVSVLGSVNRDWTDVESYDRTVSGARPADSRAVTGTVRAQVSVPLYTGGGAEARVREAKQRANQQRILIEQARRQAVDDAVRNWQNLLTARAAIESRRAQVRSAEIALEGVRQEATVGSRTVLDTLDAEQELLDARVSLVVAERDEVVAAFDVLQAIGQLTARQLGLPVEYYDYEAYYNSARDKWWGTSID
ncbi:MAG TPA: TolC family outer membrane protein [Azospirillaceae bacterium]|nr:TolC family outer membrane protein [Azospirillaceae bacterium]